VLVSSARGLAAQDPVPPPRGPGTLKFLAGAGVAFVSHESGHLAMNLIFQDHPYLSGVQFGPIPFFAVSHHDDIPKAQVFAVTSAGFWVQEAMNEWILGRHPHLRAEHRPMMKGALAFNVIMPAGYAIAGAFGFGPPERDPRSMADAARVSQPVIGMFVLVPALLDGYRYFHPEARWPAWVSRAVKIGSVALVLRATSR
jgi:hypothetical protein